MGRIHSQLKRRRKELGLKQEDMTLRAGMSRQQYQRLESKGNPRLETLELVAKGLKLELMLVPREKLEAVKAIIEGSDMAAKENASMAESDKKEKGQPPDEDPWEGLLGDEP